MAKFHLTATRCTFEQRASLRCLCFEVFGDQLARETIEAKTIADLDAALADFADRIGKEHKGSYFVSQHLVKGERAPAGYRKRSDRSLRIEVDRCPKDDPADAPEGDRPAVSAAAAV